MKIDGIKLNEPLLMKMSVNDYNKMKHNQSWSSIKVINSFYNQKRDEIVLLIEATYLGG